MGLVGDRLGEDFGRVGGAYRYLIFPKLEVVEEGKDFVEDRDFVEDIGFGEDIDLVEAYRYLYVVKVLLEVHMVVEEDNLDLDILAEEHMYENVVNYYRFRLLHLKENLIENHHY